MSAPARPVIAVFAQGTMGAGIAGRLSGHGYRVLTVLEGRSTASTGRAAAAGMIAVDWPEAAAADIFLSLVPPSQALPLAQRMAPLIGAAGHGPLYADLNAISPATVRTIGALLTAAGAKFADGGICGAPPESGGPGPAIYASGPAAGDLAQLADAGLDIRRMDAPAGAASALKICQSALTKGYTALGAIVVTEAMRHGIGGTLRQEMRRLRPGLDDFLAPATLRMFDKARRYEGEMLEIRQFLQDSQGGAEIFDQFAQLYRDLAANLQGPNEQIDLLRRYFRATEGMEQGDADEVH